MPRDGGHMNTEPPCLLGATAQGHGMKKERSVTVSPTWTWSRGIMEAGMRSCRTARGGQLGHGRERDMMVWLAVPVPVRIALSGYRVGGHAHAAAAAAALPQCTPGRVHGAPHTQIAAAPRAGPGAERRWWHAWPDGS